MTVLPAHSTGDHRKGSLSNRTGTRVVLVDIDRHRMQTASTSRGHDVVCTGVGVTPGPILDRHSERIEVHGRADR